MNDQVIEQEIEVSSSVELAPQPTEDHRYSRRFFQIRNHNAHSCNLTELRAAESVDEGFISHNDWMAHITRYDYTRKVIEHGKLPINTHLDVGCGAAKVQLPYFLWKNRTALESNYSYWGIDLRVREKSLPPEGKGIKGDVTLLQMDALIDNPTFIEGWPGQFDLVTCYEALEHVPREKAATLMARLYDWTRPGGVCLLSTPNAGVSKSTADNHKGTDGISREWSYEDKLSMAANAGFVVSETFGTFCGVTRLPSQVRARFISDPILAHAKKYLSHAMFTVMVAAAFPAESNNSLFHLVRPN